MYKRKLILLLAGPIVLFLLYLLPMNRQWFHTLAGYWNAIPNQKNNLDAEARRKVRFGNDYTYTKLLGDSIRQKAPQDALVLVPPTTYFAKMGVKYHVPVSPVFYYYTGIKTVWANNPHAPEADWYVRVQDGRIVVERATDKKSLHDTIAAFQKLGVYL